jgi:hypothetical protein
LHADDVDPLSNESARRDRSAIGASRSRRFRRIVLVLSVVLVALLVLALLLASSRRPRSLSAPRYHGRCEFGNGGVMLSSFLTRSFGAAVLVAGMASGGPAHAADEKAEKAEKARDVSVTISPLHLLMPLAEVDVEARLGDFLGLAVLGGIGQVSVEDSLDREQDFAAYEVGVRFIGYPLEPFESLQVGAEVLWVKVSSDELQGGSVQGAASGVAAGPFLGYKLITRGGFTLFVEGGVEYMFIRAEASDATETQREEDSRWIPLLNANLGWSF